MPDRSTPAHVLDGYEVDNLRGYLHRADAAPDRETRIAALMEMAGYLGAALRRDDAMQTTSSRSA